MAVSLEYLSVFLIRLNLQPLNFFCQLAIPRCLANISKVILLSLNHEDILDVVVLGLVSVELLDKLIAKDLNELSVSYDHVWHYISNQTQRKVEDAYEKGLRLVFLIDVL